MKSINIFIALDKFRFIKFGLDLILFSVFIFSAHYIQQHSPFLKNDISNIWNFSFQILFKAYIGCYVVYTSMKLGISLSIFLPKKSKPTQLNPFDTGLVSTILGLSVLQIIFFLVGLFGLLQEWIIFLIFFICGMAPSNNILKDFKEFINQKILLYSKCWLSIFLQWAITVSAIIYVINIGITKAQVPLFNDFVHHYGQYFLQTAIQEKIQPNQVWYQFFYSKGDALAIALVKISDITAKLLSSFLYYTLSCLILARIVSITSKSIFWGTFSICLLSLIIFTDNTQAFEKQHTAIIFCFGGVVYCLILIKTKLRDNLLQIYSLLSLILSTTLLSLPSSVYLIVMLFGGVIFFASQKKWWLVKLMLALFFFSTISVLIVFILNYYLTGYLENTPFRVFLPYINFAIFSNWVSPYLIMYKMLGTNPDMGKVILNFSSAFERLFEVSRLRLLSNFAPLPVFAILIISGLLPNRSTKDLPIHRYFPIYLSCIILVLTYLSYATITQPLSVYRATQFSAFFMCIIICVGCSNIEAMLKRVNKTVSALMPTCLAILITIPLLNFMPKNSSNDYRLTWGEINLDNYYLLNSPPDTFDAYILIHKIREMIGVNNKILSLDHAATFGRYYLVGIGIITELSYSLGPNWHKIGLLGPETSKNELKNQGINYFVINLNSAHIGLLPYSQLFDSQNINDYFDVIASQGSWRVLTWASQSGLPKLTMNELQKWDKVKDSSDSFRPLFENLKTVYNYNSGKIDQMPMIPPGLPSSNGWQ